MGAGLLAFALVQGVRSLDLSWLAWDRGGPYVAGGVVLGAALYELSPALEHGAFCVGSSWALMSVLFALGVMNVAWMIVVAGLVAIEKLLPWNGFAVAATMAFAAVLGVAVAIAPGQVPGLTIPS